MNQSPPTLSYQSLKPWFDKPALINDCVAQVQKDLGSYGISLKYSGNTKNAYEELFVQLKPQIQKLLNTNRILMEILYRVDVSEETVKKASEGDEDFSELLTRLILWRELQKVVTRFILR